MLYFTAKMPHSAPDPAGGSHSTSPDPYTWIFGNPTSKRKEKRKGKGEDREKERGEGGKVERKGRGKWDILPPP